MCSRFRSLALAALLALAVAGPARASGVTTIVEPAAGARVGGAVRVVAAAPDGTTSVEFAWSADGETWNVLSTDADVTDGWAAWWDSRGVNGAVWLRATSSGGAVATLAVTADNDPPVLLVGAPAAFSPNGDGIRDVALLSVTVDGAAAVEVSVLDPHGREVRLLAGPVTAKGELRMRWNGRDDAGTPLGDALYRISARASDEAGNVATADAPVRVDTRAPRLWWRSRPTVVGAEPLAVRFVLGDASAPLTGRFRFESAYGRVVRTTVTRGLTAGPGSLTVPRLEILAMEPGHYHVRLTVEDAAGNRSELLSPPYRLDHPVSTRVLRRVDNAGGRVALTFDDCSSAWSWRSILGTLARFRVTAAFFCTGIHLRSNPGLATLTASAGHTVGSHGWDHAGLFALSYWGALERLTSDRCVWWRWLAAATPYFRPPYGSVTSSGLAAAGAAGYRYTVLWDVDPQDWRQPGVGAIVSRAVWPARPGSIILLHTTPQTAAALPGIITALRGRGLQPIGLDELLHRGSA